MSVRLTAFQGSVFGEFQKPLRIATAFEPGRRRDNVVLAGYTCNQGEIGKFQKISFCHNALR